MIISQWFSLGFALASLIGWTALAVIVVICLTPLLILISYGAAAGSLYSLILTTGEQELADPFAGLGLSGPVAAPLPYYMLTMTVYADSSWTNWCADGYQELLRRERDGDVVFTIPPTVQFYGHAVPAPSPVSEWDGEIEDIAIDYPMTDDSVEPVEPGLSPMCDESTAVLSGWWGVAPDAVSGIVGAALAQDEVWSADEVTAAVRAVIAESQDEEWTAGVVAAVKCLADMTTSELVAECRARGIRAANSRWSRATLITRIQDHDAHHAS